MKILLRHSVIVIVIKGIKNIKAKCQISLSRLFVILILNAVTAAKINGQIKAKASKSHFAENSCEVKALTLKTTNNKLASPITIPVILDRLVEVISKIFLSEEANQLCENIAANIMFRVEDKLAVLTESSLEKRMNYVLKFLKNEFEVPDNFASS